MDHDTARDWIDEAVVTPAAGHADDAAARAARAHLTACPDCADYAATTQRAMLKLDLARGPAPEVRARVMTAAHRIAVARGDAARPAARQPWWRRPLAWRLAAAALALALVGAIGGAWWAGTGRPDNDADHLPDAVALMSTLASEPGAQEVVLRDTAGASGGIAVISAASHRLAVFATNLPAGSGYHCYVERAGQRTWMGTMYVAPGVQFWAGAMDPSISMQPGDSLVVTRDPADPAVISATL